MTTATAEKAAKGRINSITGIIIDKLDPKLVAAAIAEVKLDVDPGASLEQAAVALYGYYDEHTPKKDRAVCASCKALSNGDLNECPFCGSEEALAVDGVPVSSAHDVSAAAKKATNKAGEQQMTTAAETAKKTNGKSHVALVKDDTTTKSSAIRTERDLDAAVAEVHRLKGEGALAYRHIGEFMMKHIYGPQLWKLRTEGGKPRYKNVDAFCNDELGMSPQHAWKLMDVARNFTDAQVKAFGTTKLGLLLEAPKEEQSKIQKRMEAGELTTKREVEKEVRKANKGLVGKERKNRHGKTGASARLGTAGTGASTKAITVAKILGLQTVKLFKKPANVKKFDPKELDRAKKIGDVPFGFLELTNEVKMYFALHQSAAGELVLKVNTVRDEE